jgi:hypothetical protein
MLDSVPINVGITHKRFTDYAIHFPLVTKHMYNSLEKLLTLVHSGILLSQCFMGRVFNVVSLVIYNITVVPLRITELDGRRCFNSTIWTWRHLLFGLANSSFVWLFFLQEGQPYQQRRPCITGSRIRGPIFVQFPIFDTPYSTPLVCSSLHHCSIVYRRAPVQSLP